MDAPKTALPAAGGLPPSPGDTPLRSPVVKRCYKALAKAVAGWADKIIFRKAKEVSGDAAWAKDVIVEISLTEPEADAFGDLAAEIGAMMGADEKMMAMAAAMVTVCAVGGRYYVVSRDLDKQLEAKRRAERNRAPKV